MISSYPSIYAVGHKAIADIFKSPVLIEEKIDGSQFSFGMVDGELMCRSKGAQMNIDVPEKMFSKAVEYIKSIQDKLHPNWIFRGEFLQKPKHNTLAYNRIPKDNIIIFDVNCGLENYLTPTQKEYEAFLLGLETVPVLYQGMISDFDTFKELLETQSILGGQKIEGIVIKNYSLFTQEKKVAMGKYVSEAFKEIHGGEWRKNNPTQSDIVDQIIAKYKTPARWNKAIQHLREKGLLEGSPRDIGSLIKEVPDDVQKECEDEIKDILFNHFWSKIRRGITSGLPEWYKDELAKTSFEDIIHEI